MAKSSLWAGPRRGASRSLKKVARLTTVAAKRVLRESQLFEELSDEELDRIAEFSREATFEAGDVIFREGDVPGEVYIVAQGKVAIDMGLRLGGQVRRRATIETVTRGHPVGWSAVVGSEVLTASARCVENTTVVVVDGKALRCLFEEDSYLGLRVMLKLVDSWLKRSGK